MIPLQEGFTGFQRRHLPDRNTPPTTPRTSKPVTPSGRNHHQDPRSTVYTKALENRGNYSSRTQATSHHKEPQISLRSRSRTKRASSPTTSRARVIEPKIGAITLRPKTPSVGLITQTFLHQKLVNPNWLKFHRLKLKLQIGEDLLRNVMKKTIKMT